MRLGIDLGIRGSRGFSPNDLSGTALWLRADSSDITLVSTKVAAWTPKVGAGITVDQSTDANRPTYVASAINGLPAVRGSSTDKFLNVAGMSAPTAATVFLVLTRTTNATTYVISGAGGAFGIIENFTADTLEWFNGSGTDRLTFAGTRTAGAHIAAVTQTNGGALTLYYDGAQVATKGTAGSNLVAVASLIGRPGGVNGTTGDIPEMIVYSSVLSATNRGKVTNYLARRYGITLV
jgi:hypothetical protein